MSYSQQELEAMFSQRYIHAVLEEAIRIELDKTFLTWALGCYLRIDDYLKGDYYDSKNKRIAELQDHIDANGLEKILLTMLVAIFRSKEDSTLQKVVGFIAPKLPHKDSFDCIKTAGELIAVCGGYNRMFYIDRDREDLPIVRVNHWNVILDLFATEFEWVDDTFYNPPLVEKPKKVDHRNCGYHTIQEPLVLGKFTETEDYLDYKAINDLAETEWVLDKDVLNEVEEMPGDLSDPEQVRNHYQHLAIANRLYSILEDRTFYLAWQYDSRGRIYSHGHHVNFQSYQYKKALLSHNHYEELTQ